MPAMLSRDHERLKARPSPRAPSGRVPPEAGIRHAGRLRVKLAPDVARTLSGNLDTFSLADLLQWLEINGLSGRVTVCRGEVLRTIDLKGGAIVFVSSSLPKERLGVVPDAPQGPVRGGGLRASRRELRDRQEPHAAHPRAQPSRPRKARGGRRGPRDEDPSRPLPLGGRLVRIRPALQDRGPHPDPPVSPRAGPRLPRRQVGGRLAREPGSCRRRRRDRRPLGEGVQARRARGPVLDDSRGCPAKRPRPRPCARRSRSSRPSRTASTSGSESPRAFSRSTTTPRRC